MDKKLETLREKLEVDFASRAVCDLSATTSAGIVVTFFELNDEICDMVKNVHSIKGSRIFSKLWGKYCGKTQEHPVTLDSIKQSICDPLIKELMSVTREFISGDIILKDVMKYLEMFNNDYEKLGKELEELLKIFPDPQKSRAASKTQLSGNIQKARDYQGLFQANLAAKAIIELRDTVGLTGNFDEVERISEVSFF